MKIIRRITAYILLVSVYGITWLVSGLAGIIPRRRWKPNGRIIVTGTFHNPGWYLSHVTPLIRSGVKEVILVVDEPHQELEGVRLICWPRWISKLLSRQGARAIWMLITGIRYRPDLYMGYHLGPGACTALMAGKIMGRPTCYQMTGGPVEIIGGGFEAAEGIGAPLGRSSKLIEKMALAVVNLFDLIVVRGNKAREFLVAHNVRHKVAIIPGSVRNNQVLSKDKRNNHIVFVGRLSPVKQIDQFMRIVSSVKRTIPDIRAVIVGDGPLMTKMKEYAIELGIINNVNFLGKRRDVEEILVHSKVFVLTSKSEGLSIAMAEAMTAGVVPVVADVGELGSLVINGKSGYLVTPNNIEEFKDRILALLQDDQLWNQYSRSAIAAAKKQCDIEVVSRQWRQQIGKVISQISGEEYAVSDKTCKDFGEENPY